MGLRGRVVQLKKRQWGLRTEGMAAAMPGQDVWVPNRRDDGGRWVRVGTVRWSGTSEANPTEVVSLCTIDPGETPMHEP